ncbi:MAG: hypothetical protein CL693_07670 [Cellvibrionaceae bacterium]|nr:hypothetical protein [Cellvibrionaceae bacterium]|tara:strand:- start:22977 stop:23975 length:999 start_codon:yes stop_codon:yes gene_type:complete
MKALIRIMSLMTSSQTINLPDTRVQRCGLPATQSSKHYWRLPTAAQADVPLAVAEQSRYAAGARLRFKTNSRSLILEGESWSEVSQQGIDCLVDGCYWRTLWLNRGERSEQPLYQGLSPQTREIELYFPAEQEISIHRLSIDTDAVIAPAAEFAASAPLVFYGSSIVQGAGASLSCMSYPAIVARALQMDFHNWGFYGAGKAEPEVVAQVIAHPASAFILDLGRSFGRQDIEVYRSMLKQIRAVHARVPIVVITPIFSVREHFDSKLAHRSEQLRLLMSLATEVVTGVTLVNGLSVLGHNDWPGLSNDGLHPNERGFELIAQRLLPTIKELL